MTIIRHANNFATTLAANLTNVATSTTLTSATGLPTLTGGDGFYLTLDDGTNVEIVLVTAYSGTSITTMARGQQGTSGTAFVSGDAAEIRPTADAFDRKADGAASSTDNAIVKYDGTNGKVLQNSGIVITDNDNLKKSVAAGITASTTQSQGQQALTKDINQISVCANANDVVTLPSAEAGLSIVVINSGANALQVFPASGDNLGAGVDTSTTIASSANKLFCAYDSTNWVEI